MTAKHRHRPLRAILALAATVIGLAAFATPAAASTGVLTRAPYLTDPTPTSVDVNWGTLSSSGTNTLTWGPAGGTCADFTAATTTVFYGVVHVNEAMHTGVANNLQQGVSYCYQVLINGVAQLSTPGTFRAIPASGSSAPFSFNVIGDTGYNGNGGTNPDQDALYAEMGASGASFNVTTGDIAYSGGTQDNYGDLQHSGANISTIFSATGLPVAGQPWIPTLGNHGRISAFLLNFPQAANAGASNGVYSMVTYPGQLGASTGSYPTAYFAFNSGPARFYVLDADWSDSNVGSSTLYGQDYANHWTPSSAEYLWLKADLAAHPGGLKMAFWHFPMYSDNSTQSSDTYLQGSNSLEGLLQSGGVNMYFNGHAHIYQRNALANGMISYTTGGGGAVLEPAGSHCSPGDAYSIGWSPTKLQGTKCGNAPVPTSASQVFHYLHVTVNGNTVTVVPTNALGQTFDPQSYTFNAGPKTYTVNPNADTYVYSGASTTAYGAANPTLMSTSSYRTLVKFDTSTIPQGSIVTGATLNVWTTTGPTSGGIAVHPSLDSWNETTTWATQPAWNSTVLATSGLPVINSWVSIPLPPSAVTVGGNTNLGLGYTAAGFVERLAGRTDAAHAPQLVITTG